MVAFRRVCVLALVCLATVAGAQQPDQLAAARVLGPQWRHIARASGMVFSGTVLAIEAQPPEKDRPLPLILTKFRIDQAIVGVDPGQVLTIREWAGAWSSHRALRSGQRILIFLYPPSRLGLTSPVGGAMGQVALDPSGKNVVAPAAAFGINGAMNNAVNNVVAHGLPPHRVDIAKQRITVLQLERAIRSAREE